MKISAQLFRCVLFYGAFTMFMWLLYVAMSFYHSENFGKMCVGSVAGSLFVVLVIYLVCSLLAILTRKRLFDIYCKYKQGKGEGTKNFICTFKPLFNIVNIHTTSELATNLDAKERRVANIFNEFTVLCATIFTKEQNENITIRFTTWLPVERIGLIKYIEENSMLSVSCKNNKLLGFVRAMSCLVLQMFDFPHKGLAKEYVKKGIRGLKKGVKNFSKQYRIQLKK